MVGLGGCGWWGRRTGLESELSLHLCLLHVVHSFVSPRLELCHSLPLQCTFAVGKGSQLCSERGFTRERRSPHIEPGHLHSWQWERLCHGPGSATCLLASNCLSLPPPRMATRRAPLTCWARTSGLPTPSTPSGKLVLKHFKREMDSYPSVLLVHRHQWVP